MNNAGYTALGWAVWQIARRVVRRKLAENRMKLGLGAAVAVTAVAALAIASRSGEEEEEGAGGRADRAHPAVARLAAGGAA